MPVFIFQSIHGLPAGSVCLSSKLAYTTIVLYSALRSLLSLHGSLRLLAFHSYTNVLGKWSTLCHPYIESATTLKIIVLAFSEPDSASTTVASSGLYVTGKNSLKPREALKMNKYVHGTFRSRGRTA